MKLFLDTNVLIDFIMERPLFYDAAAMIVSYAFSKESLNLCINSVNSYSEFYLCRTLQNADRYFPS